MPQDRQYTSSVHLKALGFVAITLTPKVTTEQEALTLHVLPEESFNLKQFQKLEVQAKK